jgi:hypothetical protein
VSDNGEETRGRLLSDEEDDDEQMPRVRVGVRSWPASQLYQHHPDNMAMGMEKVMGTLWSVEYRFYLSCNCSKVVFLMDNHWTS